MEQMGAEQYLAERLDDQLGWYDKKSQWNQSWFKRLRLAEIVAAATIPFLAGMGVWSLQPVVIGLLGMLVAVAAAAISLFKYQENWIQYRTTAEQLRHEKFLFLTNVAPYHGAESFALLVERVENLISRENSLWSQSAQQKASKGTEEQTDKKTGI
jgi:hypothetical protein